MMGYGLILCRGNQVSLIGMGVLKVSVRKDAYERLRLIHKKVLELVSQFQPNDFAIEAPFFGKNVQSMLKLGRAQGVAIAAAMQAGIPVTEYSPKKVKQSITGNGNSGKEQVWKMLQNILSLKEDTSEYDASDALAVAVCHHFQNHFPGRKTGENPGKTTGLSSGRTTSKKSAGWEAFIKQNPGKIRTR